MSLVASGTTPKMVYREKDVRVIGYGAMVLEGFVSVAALTAACALAPGDYFKINLPPAQLRGGGAIRPGELQLGFVAEGIRRPGGAHG